MVTQAAPRRSGSKVGHRAMTPVAGAIAGIAFAVLFGVCMIILRQTMGDAAQDTGAWLTEDAGLFAVAIALVPWAGMAFLWFIAESRDRLGKSEDQFYSTVFLGSGLLFLAMVFVGAAGAAAMVAAAKNDPTGFAVSTTYTYARQTVAQVMTIYALRMAAIFMISQAALWMRTKVMPRWMAVLTVAVAFVLLFVFTRSFWVVLVFPAWVFLVSTYILIALHRAGSARAGDDESIGASSATP